MSGLLYKSVSTDLSNVGRSKKENGEKKENLILQNNS